MVLDPLKLDPKGVYMVAQEPKPDKTMIREMLKHGEEIKGATLEVRENIQIK